MSTLTFHRSAFVNFKEVKSRVTFIQILDRYGLTDTLNRSGNRLSGPCPLHRGTNPTQFRVSISKNCWNSFGNCGRGGNVIDFVSLREGVPFREAALLLQDWFFPDKTPAKVAESSLAVARSSSPSPPNHHPPQEAMGTNDSGDEQAGENPPLSFELKTLKADHPYFAERGLTQETVETFGMGYCSKGYLRGYIAIPIRNREGKLVAYMGRWPGDPVDGKPKYKFPKGFRKSLELFNANRILKGEDPGPLCVVEGVFDCLHLIRAGYPRTVALLGCSLSSRQEVVLTDLTIARRDVCLLFDADDAGRKAAAETAAKLRTFCDVRVIDIGSYSQQPDHVQISDIKTLISGVLPES